MRKLRHKYRLVIINDNTFDERLSLLLTPLNVIALVGLSFFLVAGITLVIIVFTPLKEYIPGYSDATAKEYAFEASRTADSLEYQLAVQKKYLSDLRGVLTGEVDTSTTEPEESNKDYENLDFSKSREDSLLRERIESEEAYSLAFDQPTRDGQKTSMAEVFFFSPLIGTVTGKYDPMKSHYAVDVAGKKDESIKAVLNGTVIFSSFTSDGGNVIQVQHDYNLISIYKHNSVLLKKVGDEVEAGDNIAIIGNSGELSDGPHLHFELWKSGKPLNPQEFIAFE